MMLVLGFSSGLPFLLVGNTLGYWLRDEGTSLAAIGFLSWVGIAYSLKVLWAPIIDRVSAPVFGRLGRRRGWMAVSQILVGLAFLAMALLGTGHGLVLLGAFALVAAFAAATQDIVIDAWRIETASDTDELGLLSSAYQLRLSHRIAGDRRGHSCRRRTYELGVFLRALRRVDGRRPDGDFLRRRAGARRCGAGRQSRKRLPLWTSRGLFDAIAGPFIMFFRTHGVLALLMLAAISLYRLPDFVMGPMTNPFYHDIGLSKDLVGAVRASIGLIASLMGIAAGGFAALRFGYERALIAGGILPGRLDRGLRGARRAASRFGALRQHHGFRQFLHELRRRRTGLIHVESDKPWLYGDAVCVACLRLCLARQNSQGLFRHDRREPQRLCRTDEGLCLVLRGRGCHRHPRSDPVRPIDPRPQSQDGGFVRLRLARSSFACRPALR